MTSFKAVAETTVGKILYVEVEAENPTQAAYKVRSWVEDQGPSLQRIYVVDEASLVRIP